MTLDDLAIVLVAAGESSRMGFDKLWTLPSPGQAPLVRHAVGQAVSARAREIVLVVHPSRLPEAHTICSGLDVQVVSGGSRRQDSVANGLAACTAPWIAVHDAARAFAPSGLYAAGLAAARATGAAIPVVPVKDTIKRVQDGRVHETLPRATLAQVQTPQVIRRDLLQAALAAAVQEVTDEAALLEARGIVVRTFPGHEDAFKVTTPLDFELARWLVRSRDADHA